MVRPTINSEKHIVQFALTTATAGATVPLEIASASANPTTRTDVRVGATIKAVYIEIWANASMNPQGSTVMIVEKQSSGGNPANFSEMGNLHDYNNKKNIFYTTQGVTGDNNSNPIPFIRQWIKIPKGKQRFGLGDSLWLVLSPIVEDLVHCGLSIYKEYY